MRKVVLLCGLFSILAHVMGAQPVTDATLRRHPDHSGSFVYKGKPIVLVTATEHYGAVLNGKFDYVPYLDELARNQLNLSRAFTFYRELEDSIPPLGFSNTLAPEAGAEVMPWKRTGPGKANDGGPKFNLDQWNNEYFTRFKNFLKAAAEREIVVEVVLFCNPYRESIWSWFPLHPANNVNGVGGGISEVGQFMELHDPTVTARQMAFVRKLVAELNSFDNMYFEINNETSARDNSRETAARQDAWHVALSKAIRETEQKLPKKHLIAVNAHQRLPASASRELRYTETGDTPYFGNALIDIINYHYISRKTAGPGISVLETAGTRFGNILAFMEARRHVNKPVVFDENYSGVIRGAADEWDRNRMEAWETILSGGAGFDHLDWSFTPQDPTGSGKVPIPDGRRLDGRRFRDQLGILSRLWKESGPDQMDPAQNLVSAVPNQTLAVSSSRKDRRIHVIYVGDARLKDAGFGKPIEGSLTLRLPAGQYEARMLPSGATGWSGPARVNVKGKETHLWLPEFQKDCAIVLRAQ
ncbi:MAG: hypothetical protein HYS04_03275 [Acidobacteria bacterium]|nr:hypothetical protein [Acidobacteriota bacterium]